MSEKIPTSDDNMIDIQIEESLGRETLMAIDSSKFSDDIVSIGGFLLILIITTITGIMGPHPVDTRIQVTRFLDAKGPTGIQFPKSQELSLFLTNVTAYNRFMTFSLSFNIDPNYEKPLPREISFSYAYKVSSSHKGAKKVKSNYIDNAHVLVVPGSKTTTSVGVFSTKIVDFDSIQFYATVNKMDGFSSVNLIEEHGYAQHTVFQVYFKTIFALIEIAFLILLLSRLSTVKASMWHLEQKLTVPLLILVILYNNPFCWITTIYPTYITRVLETVFRCLFTVYFRFFILVLFDSLRYKNRKTDEYFFGPKVVYCIIDFLVMVSHGVYDDISYSAQPHFGCTAVKIVELVIFCGYLVWTGVSITAAACQVDITERYKFTIYMVSGLSALILLGLCDVLLDILGLFEYTALKFVESYAIQNIFVMLMAYFHWPYEVLHDQNYMDGEEINQATAPEDFFVNNDSE